jgi:hypothetical protein
MSCVYVSLTSLCVDVVIDGGGDILRESSLCHDVVEVCVRVILVMSVDVVVRLRRHRRCVRRRRLCRRIRRRRVSTSLCVCAVDVFVVTISMSSTSCLRRRRVVVGGVVHMATTKTTPTRRRPIRHDDVDDTLKATISTTHSDVDDAEDNTNTTSTQDETRHKRQL